MADHNRGKVGRVVRPGAALDMTAAGKPVLSGRKGTSVFRSHAATGLANRRHRPD